MADILHRIEIEAPAARVYEAITTQEGLASWWTRTTRAEAKIGAVLQFRFGQGGPDMRVTELEKDRRVGWECIAASPDWVGTRFSFDLAEEGGKTILRFGHRGWKETSDFYAHCNSRWGYFLLSLKSSLEHGAGTPYPDAIAM